MKLSIETFPLPWLMGAIWKGGEKQQVNEKHVQHRVMINSPCNLLSQSLFFIPRGTSRFYYEVTAEFYSQDCADFSPDMLMTVHFRSESNTSSIFPLLAALPCHPLCGFPFPSATNQLHFLHLFIYISKSHPRALFPRQGSQTPCSWAGWVVDHRSLLLLLPSPNSSSQGESLQVTSPVLPRAGNLLQSES